VMQYIQRCESEGLARETTHTLVSQASLSNSQRWMYCITIIHPALQIRGAGS
jgi:hypothetical protein